ncbi:hypothetical protein SAMN05428958_102124 [Pantoea sesami]|nr:hypothetical protein SAMN05428958_102124 [Pantoea sesami]
MIKKFMYIIRNVIRGHFFKDIFSSNCISSLNTILTFS